MSAPEFASLRPIPGTAVLSKALLYSDPKARELAFFLQAMSMQVGGLESVAEKLVRWFPERCREQSCEVANILRLAASLKEVPKPNLTQEITKKLLSTFLTELILNPKVSLAKIEAPCFRNLEDALNQFKSAHEQAGLAALVPTAASEAICETLDQALALSRMVVIEGLAGSGKSTSALAWCAARTGLVRYISLTGITNRTTFFQKIATAIGLATCQRKSQQLQIRVEEFFARSKMMLVIDESHYAWPQSTRQTTAPELIDWINTALVNYGVPVGLLCTDQFSKLKNRVERNTGWTSEQFIHRVYRFKKLTEKPSQEDVTSVTRSLLSAVWNEDRKGWTGSEHAGAEDLVEALALYSLEQKIPLSCVSSCVQEARSIARASGRIVVTRGDLKRALSSGQIPSDVALSRAFAPTRAEKQAGNGRGRNRPFVEAANSVPKDIPRNSVSYQELAVSPLRAD